MHENVDGYINIVANMIALFYMGCMLCLALVISIGCYVYSYDFIRYCAKKLKNKSLLTTKE